MMSALDKATMLGKLARLLWEAYPDEDIEVGTTRSRVSAGIWDGREMTIRVRCWIEEGRYFAMDLQVERGATPEGLFDEARYAIVEDGPGWVAS